jgi:hypothetical protein
VARGSSLDRQHLSPFLHSLYPDKPKDPIPQVDAGLTAQRKDIEELREHAVNMVFEIAGAVDDHLADPVQQRGGARDPGLRPLQRIHPS